MSRHVATAAEHRAQAVAVANMLAEVSVTRAEHGDLPAAVACQWVGDVHRVVAALWGRAAGQSDPHQQFFAMAEQALTAADQVPAREPASGAALIAELRAAFTSACSQLNLPLVFPQAGHISSSPVDLTCVRDDVLGGAAPADAVERRLAAARQAGGARGLRLALEAYMVDVAHRTGDDLMLTASARIHALAAAAPADLADVPAVESAGKRILGPVEWVRARPYLARGGAA